MDVWVEGLGGVVWICVILQRCSLYICIYNSALLPESREVVKKGNFRFIVMIKTVEGLNRKWRHAIMSSLFFPGGFQVFMSDGLLINHPLIDFWCTFGVLFSFCGPM